jgi:hypothetical protein
MAHSPRRTAPRASFAPDLHPDELGVARRFQALARRSAPADLESRCLDPARLESARLESARIDAARCNDARPDAGLLEPAAARLGRSARRWAPLAWAAALLLAFGVAALARSGGSTPATAGAGSAYAIASAPLGSPPAAPRQLFEVVDDPSVPLFHTVETFDRLTPAPMVAWQGGSR